jgi:hypothetical protein
MARTRRKPRLCWARSAPRSRRNTRTPTPARRKRPPSSAHRSPGAAAARFCPDLMIRAFFVEFIFPVLLFLVIRSLLGNFLSRYRNPPPSPFAGRAIGAGRGRIEEGSRLRHLCLDRDQPDPHRQWPSRPLLLEGVQRPLPEGVKSAAPAPSGVRYGSGNWAGFVSGHGFSRAATHR